MRRILKWLGFTIVGLVFLIVAVLGVAYFYKQDVIAAINEEVKKNINGDFVMGDLSFSLWEETPGFSITLSEIALRGPQYNEHKRDFLSAKKVYINVRLLPLLRKTIVVRSIRVTHGEIFIYRTKSGSTNLEVFKKNEGTADTAKSATPVLVFFRKVLLEDVKFSFQDSLKKKSIGLDFIDVDCEIAQADSSSRYSLSGPMKFGGLMFNSRKGSYLKDINAMIHWDLEFLPNSRQLKMHASSMQFSKSTINLSGDFFFAPPGRFVITVSSDKLDYDEGASLLTEAIRSKLGKIKIDQALKMATTIDGEFAPGTDPKVDIDFQFHDSRIQAYSVDLEKATVVGSFSTHVDETKPFDDHNSIIRVKSFDGVFKGFPTHLEAAITDLIEPRIEIKASTDVDLRIFNTMGDSTRMQVTGGKFDAEMEYAGKLKELLDTSTTRYEGTLKGAAQVTNGSLAYLPRKQVYEKINLSVNFDKEHLVVNETSFTLNKSPVTVKGEVTGFVPFFVQPKTKGYVKVSVYSPFLDMGSVLSKNVPSKGTAKAGVEDNKKKSSTMLDRLLEKVEFELKVQLDQLAYQNLRAQNLKGTVVLADNKLSTKDFKMNLAGGEIMLYMTFSDLQKRIKPLYVRGSVKHADIKKFFYAFDNFKLTTITYQNLEGKIDMEVWFQSPIDDDFKIQVPWMTSDIRFSIKKGRLIDFAPLENMSNFLFKKRDFSDVQFGEIKSYLSVRGTEIDVSKMEVESSVLRLFVEGRYSMKNGTDMEVQVPLSNLKKRDKDYKPQNVGVDTKVGPSVYLHVFQDDKGKTVISYDPFKKHVKKGTKK